MATRYRMRMRRAPGSAPVNGKGAAPEPLGLPPGMVNMSLQGSGSTGTGSSVSSGGASGLPACSGGAVASRHAYCKPRLARRRSDAARVSPAGVTKVTGESGTVSSPIQTRTPANTVGSVFSRLLTSRGSGKTSTALSIYRPPDTGR